MFKSSFRVLFILYQVTAVQILALPQPPIIQIETTSNTLVNQSVTTKPNPTANTQLSRRNVIRVKTSTEPSFVTKIYMKLIVPLRNIINVPKVHSVMTNIGTCVVNGAVELISYYFPAPLIPIIASAAGMLVPFEPVLMLRDRLPINSYRRAFATALNTFLGNFDKYKLTDNHEYDPYMTQRFNRRMMNFGSSEKQAIPQIQSMPKTSQVPVTSPGNSFKSALEQMLNTISKLNEDYEYETDPFIPRRHNRRILY